MKVRLSRRAAGRVRQFRWGAFLALAAAIQPLPARENTQDRSAADTAAARTYYQESIALYQKVERDHGRHADLKGIRLHYLEWGDRSGIPLIWSHASGSSAYEIYGVAEGLVRAGYHLFALTHRGHGETSAGTPDFSLAMMADDIHAFLGQRRIPCAVIGGWSMGGFLATTFYENYPAQALGIVLEDGGGDIYQNRIERFAALNPEKDRVARVRPLRDPVASPYQAFLDGLPAYERHNPRPRAPDPQQVARYELRRMVYGLMLISSIRQNAAGLWENLPEMMPLYRQIGAFRDPARNHESGLLGQSLRRVHPLLTYRNLSVPMLIFDPTADDAGGRGYNYMTPDYERLRAQHPSLVEIVTYPDATHEDAHLGDAQRFIQDMERYLKRLRASQTGTCPGSK